MLKFSAMNVTSFTLFLNYYSAWTTLMKAQSSVSLACFRTKVEDSVLQSYNAAKP